MSFLSNIFSTPKPQTVYAPMLGPAPTLGPAPAISAPNINFTPPSFSGGGLTATFGGNGYNVGADANRQATVGGVAQTFGQQAGDIGALRSQFTPGFSALRNSLMSALQNNRTAALGNLRDNLAQRRVLGSSFAQNSLATADQEYQKNIEQIQTQTFLTELSAQQQLIQQQYTAARGQFQTSLDEMNLEAGLAADLTGRATTALSSAATTQAQLDFKASSENASNFMDVQKINASNFLDVQKANASNFMGAQEANQRAQAAYDSMSMDQSSGFGKFFGSIFSKPIGKLVDKIL